MIHSFSKRLTKALFLCCAVFFSLSAMCCSLFEPVEKGDLTFTVTSEMVRSVKESLSGNFSYSDPVEPGKESSDVPENFMFIKIALSKGFNAEQTVPFTEGKSIVFKDVPVGIVVEIEALVFERYENEGKEQITDKFTGKKIITTVPGNNDVELELYDCSPVEPVDPVEPDDPVAPDPDDPVEPVSQLIQKTIYVSSEGSDESYDVEGEDGIMTEVAADGSEDMPFGTVKAALDKIIDEGNKYIDWTISVSGQLVTASTVVIPAEITSDKAHSILLTGLNGVDEATGEPQDVINRGSTGAYNGSYTSSVLKVSSSVPVTVTNLKLTGGKTENGGGINISSNACVSLGDGVLITKNRSTRGGAVFNQGKLFVYGSAVIGDVNAKDYGDYNSTQNLADNKCANYAGSGGGIYNGDTVQTVASTTIIAKLYLGYKMNENGEPEKAEWTGGIYYSGAATGGAVYNARKSYVYFDSGTLKYNGISGDGAGIYNAPAGRVEMSGGSIIKNRASYSSSIKNGGGVCNDYLDSVFVMSGGVINENQAITLTSNGITLNSTDGKGGGVFNGGKMFMYGDAVIGNKNAETFATDNSCGNIAGQGGGIYNDYSTDRRGYLYIGYKPGDDGVSPVKAELRGGIYNNYACYGGTQYKYGGGGICSTSTGTFGTVQMSSGTVAYNAAACYGGAILAKELILYGGTIENNRAELAGGAVFMHDNTDKTLTLGSDILIPLAGNEENGFDNDISLYAGTTGFYSKIVIASALHENFKTRLTFNKYISGIQVVSAASSAEGVDLSVECTKFAVADEVNDELITARQWCIDANGKLTSKNPLVTITIEPGSYSDMTVSACSYENKATYESSSSSGTAIDGSTSVTPGTYLVFTASLPSGKTLATGTSYTWYLDGEIQEFPTTVTDTSKFGVDTSVGVYDIAVEATDSDGTSYSIEYHITVKAN